MKSNESRVVPLIAPQVDPDETEARVIGIDLGSGRRIEIEERGSTERLTVRSPEGHIELRIRLTAEGPVLDVEAIALSLRATGEVSVDCERLVVNARENVAIEAGGTISQRATGDHEVEASGTSTHRASSVRLESSLGNIDVQANDDVVVRGERIRLN